MKTPEVIKSEFIRRELRKQRLSWWERIMRAIERWLAFPGEH